MGMPDLIEIADSRNTPAAPQRQTLRHAAGVAALAFFFVEPCRAIVLCMPLQAMIGPHVPLW